MIAVHHVMSSLDEVRGIHSLSDPILIHFKVACSDLELTCLKIKDTLVFAFSSA